MELKQGPGGAIMYPAREGDAEPEYPHGNMERRHKDCWLWPMCKVQPSWSAWFHGTSLGPFSFVCTLLTDAGFPRKAGK